MNTLSPKNKTIITTCLLSAAGIFGLVYSGIDIYTSLPLIIFYFIITLNTYFSLKLFTSLVLQQTFIQHLVDAALIAFYLMLAFSFNFPVRFIFAVTILFVCATLKYALLLGVIDYPVLLKKKIIIDIMGILLGLTSLGGILMGYPILSSWYIAIVFALGNIFFLIIRPMYRLEN